MRHVVIGRGIVGACSKAVGGERIQIRILATRNSLGRHRAIAYLLCHVSLHPIHCVYSHRTGGSDDHACKLPERPETFLHLHCFISGERRKRERIEGKEERGEGRKKEEGRLAVNPRLGRDGRFQKQATGARYSSSHCRTHLLDSELKKVVPLVG